jgi:hypothetical protein
MNMKVVQRRERLLDICKTIVADPRSIGADTAAALQTATMKYVATQYDDPTQVLKRLYADEGELGSLLRKAVAIVGKYDGGDDGGGDDGGSGSDHPVSTVADLLVEAGSFPHRSAALHHLLCLRPRHTAGQQHQRVARIRFRGDGNHEFRGVSCTTPRTAGAPGEYPFSSAAGT